MNVIIKYTEIPTHTVAHTHTIEGCCLHTEFLWETRLGIINTKEDWRIFGVDSPNLVGSLFSRLNIKIKSKIDDKKLQGGKNS